MNKRVLITGVSGLLGSNLAHCWQTHYTLAGIFNTHPVVLKGVALYQADLLDTVAFNKVLDEFKPQVIVHAAALANVDVCEADHALADAMNITAARQVHEAAGKRSIKLVHISTDAIYDGSKGNYNEADLPNPVNYYAVTKLKAELSALQDANALVMRTSFYGFNIIKKQSLAEWVIGELGAGRAINGFTDVISSNIFTFDLAAVMTAMIEKDLTGVYNVASSDALSKYDFARELARVFNLDASLIKPASVDSVGFKAARPKDLSLNTAKLAGVMEGKIPSSRDSIGHFYQQYAARFNP